MALELQLTNKSGGILFHCKSSSWEEGELVRCCFAGYGADGVVMGVARSSDRVL